jgi:hypothetical protein
MLKMFLLVGAIDKNIVKVNHYKLANERAKGLIHHPHESARGIR